MKVTSKSGCCTCRMRFRVVAGGYLEPIKHSKEADSANQGFLQALGPAPPSAASEQETGQLESGSLDYDGDTLSRARYQRKNIFRRTQLLVTVRPSPLHMCRALGLKSQSGWIDLGLTDSKLPEMDSKPPRGAFKHSKQHRWQPALGEKSITMPLSLQRPGWEGTFPVLAGHQERDYLRKEGAPAGQQPDQEVQPGAVLHALRHQVQTGCES